MSKILVITGGSRGIGAATALLAADRGYTVCINYRKNQATAEAIVGKIKAKGGNAIAVAADVSLESDVKNLFKVVDDQLGPISALVSFHPETRDFFLNLGAMGNLTGGI
jgi:NAD(P)-dependent dehydrogenase (short-subunit alcohol dehydrogenase family)